MRMTLSLLCLVTLLAFATPAQAQLRADLGRPAPAAVYEEANASGGLGQSLEQLMSTLFSDDHFRMAHSYEMSFSSFGGGSSLGMYTNSMQWQFGQEWAARVDVALAHQPFGGGMNFAEDGQNMRVFLRNAEVAYRPSENMEFRLQVRQSPYGRYASPRRYGSPTGYGRMMNAFSPPQHMQRGGLFWQDQQRN